MIISNLETILSISKNCLSIEEETDGIVFSRFTEKQKRAYESSPVSLLRSKCPSGVSLDFYTDSEYICFEFTVRGRARNWLYFDIYVNDIFVESINYDIEDYGYDKFHFAIDKTGRDINRITIYLPHLADIALRNMELSDGAICEKAGNKNGNLLCLGDSITQGMNALHPSSAFPVQLSRFFNMNLLNQGVGGYVFNKSSLDGDMPYKPHIVTVAYGTNDWNRCDSFTMFQQNCSDYINLLSYTYRDSHIFVITPVWRNNIKDIKPAGSFSGIADCIRNICSGFQNITVVNGLELVPNMTGFFGDGTVHPSDEGFLHYSINLIKHISKSGKL